MALNMPAMPWRAMVDEKTEGHPDAPIYWHDMTAVAFESLRSTFEHVVRVFANGAAPLVLRGVL